MQDDDLRIWFAGQALTGILAGSAATERNIQSMANQTKGGMLEAKAAVEWADALMKALGKEAKADG